MTEGYKELLVSYLLNHRDFVTGPALSSVLNVSTKTISRTVKAINRGTEEQPIIESKRGRGYRLNYQRYVSQSGETDKFLNVNHLTSVERRNDVIKELLITSPGKHRIADLFHKYYVSDSVIFSDVRVIKEMLQKYNLKLCKQSDYLWVEGEEVKVRYAINNLLVTDNVTNISHFLQSNKYIREQDASFATRQLNVIEEKLHSSIPYPYNVNLFSHLYILIERYRSVSNFMQTEPSMTAEEKEKLRNDPRVTEVCKLVMGNLSRYLNAELPSIEYYYLFQYLTSSRINREDAPVGDVSGLVRSVTDFLIDKVTENDPYQHIGSQKLFQNLSKHIYPLINRLENNIKVKNNLLKQIKLEYPQLFRIVKDSTRQLSERYDLAQIDDAEVGFITLYFAEAAESTRPPINAVVVCTTGFGTAQLLKAKLAKRFSELNVVELIAKRDLAEEIENSAKPIDLIISTVNLPESIEVPTLVVSALLTMEDQERLERMIGQVRRMMVS